MIPTGRRARPGPAGGRPAELYRAGRAWSHGGPIHRLSETRGRDRMRAVVHDSVRAAGGAANRGGRAARAEGRRGPRQGPRHDGQPVGLRLSRRGAVLHRATSPACGGRSTGSSAASWREKSKPSAQPSHGSRSATRSSACSGLRRARGVRLCCGRAARLAHKPAGMTFEEAASVLRRRDHGAGVPAAGGPPAGPEDPRLRRVRIDRHGGRAARQALRRPRHRGVRHQERRARAIARRRRGRRLHCGRTSRRTARRTTSSSTPSASTRSGGAEAR